MKLRIQYASDLHLEFPANKEYLKQQPLQPVGDVLVLAGDIVPFAVMHKHTDFFKYVSEHFATTYWLPGNHEYYHYDMAEKNGVLNEPIHSNVFLVNNISVLHGNVHLIFSTLWSRISPGNQWQIERGLNDFYLIKYKGFRFSVQCYNEQHVDCLASIQNELKNVQTGKVALFTHHCPSFFNYPEQYKGDVLNEAFAVELYGLIESSNIDYWVYGHHHCNIPQFTIGKTKLITNQLGYVQQNEHQLFENNKMFEM
ncbi:MAG TPA: metallophosphoesterase [Tenuifilaceae bacterium]|nr:metallophosphoesterase [Tenuifilaceae bacterium]